MRVLIADDHPLYRMGLAYALAAQGFEVVAEVADGAEALAVCGRGGVEVAVLDVRMPKLDGVAACAEIRALEPAPLVVLLTTFGEPAIIEAARRAGASAYLSKETSASDLARTLRLLADDPERRLLPEVELPPLTPRERDVLALLAEGLTHKQMAARLQLSPVTVKDYLQGLYRKLEVNDRVSALRVAAELGLA